jgi:D-glycero-alpha-D-manno-heptose-7-phosphate kinase
MILSRTPFRVSFFGGGTDYPSWYHKRGGAVLSTTIDKYCYISCRYFPPFFADARHRIVWSHIEVVSSSSEILHPAVRHGMKYLGFDDSVGLEIHHQGDLPARSGMGSSSAFAVGLLRGLLALRGISVTSGDLARRAIELEQDVMKENVGSQDQVAAAFGGLNVIRFCMNGQFTVEPVSIERARLAALQERLMLFYTGTSRLGSAVAAEIIANMPQNSEYLVRIHEMVDAGSAILSGVGTLDDFGELLHEGWTLKKRLSSMVSNSIVDGIYETARKHGAIGGKLLGAGASGFMLIYAPPERRQEVINSLPGYLHVPFGFDSTGSTLVHYDGNNSRPPDASE